MIKENNSSKARNSRDIDKEFTNEELTTANPILESNLTFSEKIDCMQVRRTGLQEELVNTWIEEFQSGRRDIETQRRLKMLIMEIQNLDLILRLIKIPEKGEKNKQGSNNSNHEWT